MTGCPVVGDANPPVMLYNRDSSSLSIIGNIIGNPAIFDLYQNKIRVFAGGVLYARRYFDFGSGFQALSLGIAGSSWGYPGICDCHINPVTPVLNPDSGNIAAQIG